MKYHLTNIKVNGVSISIARDVTVDGLHHTVVGTVTDQAGVPICPGTSSGEAFVTWRNNMCLAMERALDLIDTRTQTIIGQLTGCMAYRHDLIGD